MANGDLTEEVLRHPISFGKVLSKFEPNDSKHMYRKLTQQSAKRIFEGEMEDQAIGEIASQLRQQIPTIGMSAIDLASLIAPVIAELRKDFILGFERAAAELLTCLKITAVDSYIHSHKRRVMELLSFHEMVAELGDVIEEEELQYIIDDLFADALTEPLAKILDVDPDA